MVAPDGYDDPATFFAEMSQALAVDHDVESTLERIAHQALKVVPNAEFCAITVRRRRGRLVTLAQTDELALSLDELQYALGEGPCMSSAVVGEPFLVHSTAYDTRWPKWGPGAADLGVHSVVCAQLSAASLHPDRDPLGAVNIYCRTTDAFDEADAERLRLYGVHAGNALSIAHLVSTLEEAVEGRHEIGVAQGVLMARYDLDRERAFESLRRYSSHANVKLRDVAGLVIDEGGLPTTYDDLGPIGT
ncbi:MAG: GAF and ANTAR domain-containing protein [Nocardioides sp.]|nr:GAF and ANTAR domain-containing protein [Nocardioides sp.]